jgi:sulfonate transport system permease protein
MSSLDVAAVQVESARPKPRRRAGIRFAGDRLLGALVPLATLVLWDVLARTGVLPANWLPGPEVVAQTIVEEATHGALFEHLGITLARVAVGFVVGASLATLTGGFTGYFRWGYKVLDPTIQALRSIPSIAWVPLFLLWLGIQESSKIALIALGAFFPVYLNTSSALQSVDPKLLEVGRVFRLSAFQMVWRILLPASLPQYVAGLRGGLGLAWMFVVAAEIMGASKGVGYLMLDGEMTGRASIVVASVILFAVLGKSNDWMVERAGAFVLRHRSGR